MPAHPVTLEGTEMLAHPMTLKGEEMLARATALKSADSNAAAACPTTTRSPKRTNPTTNAGKDSPKMSTRPTMTNAANIPTTETSTWPMLPPTRALLRHDCHILRYDRHITTYLLYLPHYYRGSEDEVGNGKDERDSSSYLILMHLWDV
jgi:hypothetical protein